MESNLLPTESTDQVSRLDAWTLQLYSIQHFDEAIKVFCSEIYEGLQCRSVLFFKYLKSFSSIVVTHSEGVAFSEVRGQGLNFSEDKNFSPIRDFIRINEHPSFKSIMDKISPNHDWVTSLCVVRGEVKGFFVFTDVTSKSLDLSYYKLAERVLSHWLSEISLVEKNHNSNRIDETTELLNRRVFMDYVALEAGRALRIKQPVSLYVIRIDNLEHLKPKLNFDRYQTLIKMVAKILIQTTRKTDYVGALAEDEYGVLLPHMSLKNARNKSKQIKNVLESAKYFSDTNLSLEVKFSMCISEYPTLAHDFEDLILSCTQKLLIEPHMSQIWLKTIALSHLNDLRHMRFTQKLLIEPHMSQIIEVTKSDSFQPDFSYQEVEVKK